MADYAVNLGNEYERICQSFGPTTETNSNRELAAAVLALANAGGKH